MTVEFLALGERRLEYRFALPSTAVAAAPDIVLLHEGLGCVAAWKRFPERLAERCGSRVLVYSRHGYGRSTPLNAARTAGYLHEEAWEWLPRIEAALGLRAPLLVGHSDGATIALLRAARPQPPVAGVLAIAPHVFVEAVTVAGLERARLAYEHGDLRARLQRFHDDVDGAFWGWNRTWLTPDFGDWNVEAELEAIRCPLTVLQGRDDEYATLEQLERIGRRVPGTRSVVIDGCGHQPHLTHPEPVLAAAADLVDSLRTPG